MKQIQDIEFMVGEDTETEDGDIICYRRDIEKLIDSIITFVDIEIDVLYDSGELPETTLKKLKNTLALVEEAKK